MSLIASVVSTAPTEVTVYNQGFALVKEVRTFDLVAGRQQVNFENVASSIETDSVSIRSISSPGSFSVLEQNYQFDLISVTAILQKAIGGRIVLNRVLPNGQKERVEGVLLSAPRAVNNQYFDGMVMRTDDGRILLNPTGEVEVSKIPEGMRSLPTLIWDLESSKAGKNDVEVSYITGGMSWRCNYVVNLDRDGKIGTFNGWVTLVNNSGTTYNDAKLKLLAGEVERNRNFGSRAPGAGMAMDAAAVPKREAFQQETFADYHLYTLQRPTTVANNEQKQVSLLEADGVKASKRLVFDPMRNYQGYRANEGEIGTGILRPQVRIEIKNTKDNKLGMPLPTGSVKVFQRDGSGSLQMLGEDAIDHTPRDETLSLFVGRAFDVVAERKRTAFEYIRKGSDIKGVRESFEIELRNRKESAETVEVIERFWGEWKIVKESFAGAKVSAEANVWTVPLKANETKKLTFTVENCW
jgi:hypothetical protein